MSRGASLPLEQVWALARLWYHNRLDPAYHGRSPEEAQAIFRRLGLHDAFWYLDSE